MSIDSGSVLPLRGAYGRQTLLADWNAGKDFQIVNGPYCSIRDLETIKADGYKFIQFYSNRSEPEFVLNLETQEIAEGFWWFSRWA